MKARQAVRKDVKALNELALEAHAVHERLGYRFLSHRMGRTLGGRA
jgi:hypothetical protein